MERRLKLFLSCTLLSTVLVLNLQAQNRERVQKKTLMDQQIADFTVQRTEGERILPFLHPPKIKIKTIGDLTAQGNATLELSVETENWYTEEGRPNTYYIKEFRARLIGSPGAFETETPTIIQLGPNREKVLYDWVVLGRDITYYKYKGNNYLENSNIESFTELNRLMTIPFRIPAFGDTDSRVRAFEMNIPLTVKHANTPLRLVVDRVTLGFFGDNEEPYPTPIATNQEFILIPGEPDYLPANPDAINTILSFDDVQDSLSGINWSFNGSLSGSKDNTSLNFVLSHSSPNIIAGVRSLGLLLFTNDGALQIKKYLKMEYPKGSKFNGPDSLLLAHLPPEDELLPCPAMLRNYTRLFMLENKVDPFEDDPTMYSDLLSKLWSCENNYDFFGFFEFTSEWNYPVIKDQGNLQLEIPCTLHGEGIKDARALFFIEYLYGDSKSSLKKGSVILDLYSL